MPTIAHVMPIRTPLLPMLTAGGALALALTGCASTNTPASTSNSAAMGGAPSHALAKRHDLQDTGKEAGGADQSTHSTSALGTETALAALAHLPVKGRSPMTGYDREQFGPAWLDADHIGCDTRNDILHRDLTNHALEPGTHDCVVTSGVLADPYTGNRIDFVKGNGDLVDIDHVVALGNAWVTGASGWGIKKRAAIANDPYNLLAVDAGANRQKGDGDAATWLPPNKPYRCTYVARQIGVKTKYHLWVTAAEKTAMTRLLSSCPGQRLPRDTNHAPTWVSNNIPAPTSTKPPAKGPDNTGGSAARAGGGGDCEPGYSPCLPITSDLDCADIPDSEKPIQVTGSDPYSLDGNGDGLGCTS